MRSPDLYQCTHDGCEQFLGASRFNKNQLHDYRHHGRQRLHCISCQRIDDDRHKKLKTLLALRNSIKCTCNQPIHTERCQLFTGGLRQKWPAMNNGMSWQDWVWYHAESIARGKKPS